MDINFLKQLKANLQTYNFDEIELTDEEVSMYLDYLDVKRHLMNTVTEPNEYICNPLHDRVESILSNYQHIKDYHVRVGKTSDGIAKMRVYSWPKQRKMIPLTKEVARRHK